VAVSFKERSLGRSAFGPVGGATARPDEALALGAVGTTGAVLAWTGFETAVIDVADTTGFGGGTGTVLALVSGTGALQTLDPNAGTAAGGEEGRGAYRSRDASARLASRGSSFPGSLRESFAAEGSMATDDRREYKSACDPKRSDGDAWCNECGGGPVGVPGI
jgi:hypothetical protein